MYDMSHSSDNSQNGETDRQSGSGLLIVAIEGRNFVSLGIRPEVLRTMRYYCQIVIEDVKTSDILLNVRTNRVSRDNCQSNIVWNEELYFEFPPNKKKKDVELKVMCFEHSPLHDHFQGEVVLPLGHLRRNRVLDQWYALARRDKKPVHGEVHLKLELGVRVPDNYVRRPSSLDGNDPTVLAYRASMPAGLDLASVRAEDKRGLTLSSPDKAFKKSIKGIRDKIKKTTKGVRGYFSEADYPQDGPQQHHQHYPSSPSSSSSSSFLRRQPAATDDEAQLRAMRESVDLSDHFVDINNDSDRGSGSFMDEQEESVNEGDHSDMGGGGGGGDVVVSGKASSKRKQAKSSKRKKKRKEASQNTSINVITDSNNLLKFVDDFPAEDGQGGWPSDSSSSLSSSSGQALATDESGEVLGIITPTVLTEHLGEQEEEEEEETDGDATFMSTSSFDDEVATYNTYHTANDSFLFATGHEGSKRKERKPLIIIEDDGETRSSSSSSEEEGGMKMQLAPSPFKKTIKGRGVRVDDQPAAGGVLRSPRRALSDAEHSDVGGGPPRFKWSGDGGGGGGYASSSGSKSSRRRQKALYASSQRLALLNRFPTHNTQSKTAIIDQRQRAYHVWLDSYHREMDEFYDETRNWKAPIGMQDSDKLDYATLGREWKRPWRKDMKLANGTKENLQECINDEMEDMESIIRKISGKASSHFEQTTLFSQSAVSAMKDIAHVERKNRKQLEKERKAARRVATLASSSPSSSSPSSPAQQRRIDPLVPNPSLPPESTGYRPLVVLFATLLILYILNRFM